MKFLPTHPVSVLLPLVLSACLLLAFGTEEEMKEGGKPVISVMEIGDSIPAYAIPAYTVTGESVNSLTPALGMDSKSDWRFIPFPEASRIAEALLNNGLPDQQRLHSVKVAFSGQPGAPMPAVYIVQHPVSLQAEPLASIDGEQIRRGYYAAADIYSF